MCLATKKGGFRAEKHIDFLKSTLEVFKKPINSVECLIGDNLTTNQKLSTIFGILLIIWAIHKFNIAVEHWIEEHEVVAKGLKYVHELMRRLRTFKSTEKWKERTYLGTAILNKNRWSFKFEFLLPNFRIEDAIWKMEDFDILPASMHSHPVSTQKHFEKFESIVANHQKKVC